LHYFEGHVVGHSNICVAKRLRALERPKSLSLMVLEVSMKTRLGEESDLVLGRDVEMEEEEGTYC
jgi:hypothetical protein